MAKIGFVFSCGGIRALAQVGALQELEKIGLQCDAVAGCSAGSIVAACVAAGKSGIEIETMINKVKTISILDSSLSVRGLQDARKIKKIVTNLIDEKIDFSELQRPLYISAANAITGEEKVFSSGNIFEAIRASIAIPGIFAPAHIGDTYYVDGGLIKPAPFSSLLDSMDKIIIINISMDLYIEDIGKSNAVQLMRKGMGLMADAIFREQMKSAPKEKCFFIEPAVAQWPLFALEKDFPALIEAGRIAVHEKMSALKKFLAE